MFQRGHFIAVCVLALALLLPGPGTMGHAAASPEVTTAVLASSTFNSDAEGWTVIDDAITPTWKASGGNPGGYVEAVYRAEDDTWYWVAPAKFLGNKAAAYGGALSFDLKRRLGDDPPLDDLDLVLEGGGLTLSYETAYDPGSTWTSYTVILHEEVGWRQDNLEPATAADMRRVLTDLTALRIRGKYQEAAGTGGLDNVILSGSSRDLIRIPGTSVIFFANRYDITIPLLGGDLSGFPLARNCLEAPCEDFLEETFPVRFGVAPGATVTVSAFGGMDYYGFVQPSVGPEGDPYESSSISSLGGISGFDGPAGALVGVFLSSANPKDATPPDTLDFGFDGMGTDFDSLSPALGQVFFIGDGLTGTGRGARQTFIAPTGATGLFLGIADAFSFRGDPGAYDDNLGAFYAQISGVLRPAIYLPLMQKP